MRTSFRGSIPRGRLHRHGIQPRGAPSPLKSGVFLFVGAILAGPMTTMLSRSPDLRTGVFAERCTIDERESGEIIARQVQVTTANESFSMFDCEDGVFHVNWSGVVTVTNTIVIGKRTTVTIVGNSPSVTDDGSTSSTGSDSTSERNRNLTEKEQLTRHLNLPRGLASAAVGVASSFVPTVDDKGKSFGPLFYVDEGHLVLQDMIVRDGYAASHSDDYRENGAGVYAKNSKVSITRCEFTNHLAEVSGGGLYVDGSSLAIVNSTFSECRAGYEPSDDDEEGGKGGGIHAKGSHVSIDGCLFDMCYAGEKGGGFNQDVGGLSVLGSVFLNNVAGYVSAEDKKQEGRGADLSFSECTRSFDGLAACGANDTLFINSYAGDKGGSVAINVDGEPSTVEFHRCVMDNCSAGVTTEEESHGEGGVFSVDEGATLDLADCTLKNNHCGEKYEPPYTRIILQKMFLQGNNRDDFSIPGRTLTSTQTTYQGGVIAFSSGGGGETAVHLRNSTFQNNTAKTGGGGVVYLMESVTVVVQGDGNVFEGNMCEGNGAVFVVTDGAELTIEGGKLSSNTAENGGVVSSTGDVFIQGGHFLDNKALDDGGVFFTSGPSTTVLEGGRFEGNGASEGGVGYVSDGGNLHVEGGNVTGNAASNEGGAFSVDDGGTIKITGGIFSKNKADFGGFLHKKGAGTASCAGAAILNHRSLGGGALYAVDGADILWECDIENNFALAGPAVYARNNVSVELRGMSVFNNDIPRGSVIFVVDSKLETYEVKFIDSSESKELSAVQVDEMSSYQAEDTYFIGFAGEGVVLSEGGLYLDDCDFSGCTSSVLVSSKPGSQAEIRNIVLGDNNYMPLADASAKAGDPPNADMLTNVEFSCGSGQTPCSTGPCYDGDVGVYCQCYERRSNQEERCVSGNVAELSLNHSMKPGPTIHPALLEADLILSHDTPPTVGGSGTEDAEGLSGSVLWNVEALQLDTMDWTIFPSTGLLLRGESITLKVVASPDRDFDGTTNVTFKATDIGSLNSTGANQDQGGETLSSFNVTFYHCAGGSFWNRSVSAEQSLMEGNETCRGCSDALEGDTQGVDCSLAGATTDTLTIIEGYWRADLGLVHVRECPNKDACKGGSEIQSVDDYCNDGYKGVVCSVCSSGYGKSATSNCHLCTARFLGAMYFVLSVAGMLVLVVAALLAVYLVRGGEAISSKVASTKASVRMLHRRSTGVLSRSAGTVVRTSFGRMDTRGVRAGGFSFRSDVSRGEEGEGPAPNSHGARSTSNEEKQEHIMSVGQRTQNPMFNQALGRPAANRGQWSTEPGRRPQSESIHTGSLGPNTISTKTARILSALPLSKIKIVIVVWQISSAFAEVTNVTFPPIYEKLLSVIGVFSLDLGWILSATCLASEVDFYDKLLIVTTGPIFLLGLLAATFHVGASPIRRNIATGRAIEMPSMFSKPTEVSLPALTNARRAQILEPPDSLTSSARSKSSLTAGTFGAQGQAPSNEMSTGTDTHTSRPTDIELDTQSNWVLNSSDNDEDKPARIPFPHPQTRDRSIGASIRFLRAISKVGPGAEDDKGQNQLWGLFARHTTMTLIILYLVYSQVSTVVFQTFSCEDYEEIGRSYLHADARIECDTPKHTMYMRYAAVMIVLYPVGIPTAFFYLLVRQRSAINPRVDNSLCECRGAENIMRQKIVQRSRNQTVAPTSFLWSAYFPSRYYYEVLECIRRLLLTGLLVFVPDTSGQVVYGCIFAFISLWVFELQKPHIDDHEIQLYRTGSLVIFFTNFLALILQAELADPESKSSAVYSVVLVMIHVMFVLSIGWNSWVTMKATFSGGDVKGVMRGEEGGAGASLSTTKPDSPNGGSSDEDDYMTEDEEAPPSLTHRGSDPEALSVSSSSICSSAPAEFLPL